MLSSIFLHVQQRQQRQMKTNPEFAPIPSYTQSSVSNASWVNVTLTKIDPDGSKTQVFFLAKK